MKGGKEGERERDKGGKEEEGRREERKRRGEGKGRDDPPTYLAMLAALRNEYNYPVIKSQNSFIRYRLSLLLYSATLHLRKTRGELSCSALPVALPFYLTELRKVGA